MVKKAWEAISKKAGMSTPNRTETSLNIKSMLQSNDGLVPSINEPQNSPIGKIFGSFKCKDDIVEKKIKK
uniref:Uncharacterized protein n=1 Tax=Glossina palpalis gambiensis TaxID=67801 RepID=A0A1B0BM68_9MUSC